MRETVRNRFNNLSISKKMMLIYVCFAVFFFLIAAAALQISFNIYSQKLYEKSLQELDFFQQKVNDGLSEIESLSYEIAMDTTVQQNLSDMMQLKYPSVDYNLKLYKMREMLLNELEPGSCVQSITYIDPHGIEQEVGVTAWTIPEENRSAFLQLVEEAKGAYVKYDPTEECPYLIGGRKIRNRLDMSLNDMGTLFLECDVSNIISKNKSRLEASHAAIYVYTEDAVIYEEEESREMPHPEYKKNSGYEVINNNGCKYFMCYLRSEETGWMYVNYFPYSEIYGQVQKMRYFLFICFLVVSVLLIFCMKRVSKVLTEPLKRLTESMQIVETGDFTAAKEFLTETERTDEIGMLTKEFRLMVEQVDTLIKENYEKQILLKDTKYKMLRAQINPHFLYNTLNVVNWMIKAGRNEEAGKMIIQLGAILHYSFARTPYATVKEELEMVKSFIAIQKTRYQGRIEFVVCEEGEPGKYMIPRMILQPLVENAITYGAEPYLEVCKIIVDVKEEQECIVMMVTDTGAGMSEEELEQIRSMNFKPKGHGIGLKNIIERIETDDERSTFEIDSAPGKGTCVTICIHKKLGDETEYV